MRADTAGAKTWLLGAVAAWALCAWLLALLGMGGSVTSLPEDPALLQPLPRAARPLPERLGPLPRYAEIGRRPLFSENRRPQPFVINPDGEDDAKRGFDYILTSVLITPRLKLAIIQPAGGGESIRVMLDQAPESHPAWRLIGLGERSAVFEGPEGRRDLSLRVYDGIGGERPTETGSPDDRVPVAPPGADARGATRGASPAEAPQAVDDATAQPAATQVQMDAIRQRIEQRRARLRDNSPPQPPANSP